MALALQLEQEERDHAACESDRESVVWLANIGELASPVGHEVNNFLNATLLHIAVLGMQVPPPLRNDLAEIRRQGMNMAGVVKQLQQYRRRNQPAPQPVDLNRALREVIRDLSQRPPKSAAGFPIRLEVVPPGGDMTSPDPLTVPIRLVLAAQLPPVLGGFADLKRLCSFLLTNAAGAVAAGGGGEITVTTTVAESSVVLRLTDTGPPVAPDQLPHFFEPGFNGREGTDSLELAACRNIVRRLQGTIQAQPETDQGLDIVVELMTNAQ